MPRKDPALFDRALVPPGTPSFADLIDDLTRQGELFPSRKRDMVSALNRIAKALGLPPGDVLAHARWLQPRLGKIAPARLGIAQKTWTNILSNAGAAMADVRRRRAAHQTDRGPEQTSGARSGRPCSVWTSSPSTARSAVSFTS